MIANVTLLQSDKWKSSMNDIQLTSIVLNLIESPKFKQIGNWLDCSLRYRARNIVLFKVLSNMKASSWSLSWSLSFHYHVAGDECRESGDCNIHKGLCCRLTRRQRMQPKKVSREKMMPETFEHKPLLCPLMQLCTYFTDTDVCIGPVASNQVKII